MRFLNAIETLNIIQPLQNPSEDATFDCQQRRLKKNSTCQTSSRLIRFAMDPQRECDFFLPAKRLKNRNYRQPLQNPSENTILIASETPEKKHPLSVQKKCEF